MYRLMSDAANLMRLRLRPAEEYTYPLLDCLGVEINSVVYTFGFCLKTRFSSYSALSRMSIDTGKPLCS